MREIVPDQVSKNCHIQGDNESTSIENSDEPYHFRAYDQLWRRKIMIVVAPNSLRLKWVHLESEFWVALEFLSIKKGIKLEKLVERIFHQKAKKQTLAFACRIVVVNYFLTSSFQETDISKLIASIQHEQIVRRKKGWEPSILVHEKR